MSLLEPFFPSLAGGMLIGLAAALLMLFTGRVAGISGIAFNALTAPNRNVWAVLFLCGLAIGAFAFHAASGVAIPTNEASTVSLIAGGLLVGLGTRIGSGCTSGHGICGLARFSTRSLVAVATFMTAGFVTVFVRLHGGW